jgi:saccharopine dehydrogenase-like NADP-dependent oxidoreductase
MKTLVLGGYGNFGARICRVLASDPAIQLLIGGRDRVRAEALAREVGGGAQGVAIDLASQGFADELRKLGVELLIHTAGPFQQQAYGVAEAAAKAGCHYIDLADGRRFVCDFEAALTPAFRAAGRVAISGASTVPALSSAVVDHLCAGWQRIDTIDICIAPAQTAPRGRATIEAVLSYCGEPVQVWTEGRWQDRPGWGQPARVTFARLKPRLGALCDIPDLELFPTRYHVGQRVMFRAALEVGLTQRVFALLSRLVELRVLPQPRNMAGVINAVAPALDFLGSALGGMVVRVTGVDAMGSAAGKSWHISADHGHGPEIPCMAAILLARKLAAGTDLPVGAHACVSLLTLVEFQPEFDRWGMVREVVDDGAPAV